MVSSDILKYTTVLQVYDTQGDLISDVNVSVRGQDAEYIYNLDGRKQFNLRDGLLGFGVHPEHQPTPGKPIKFLVELSGPNYLTQVIPVTIVDEQFSSVYAVTVLDLSNPPAGVTAYRPTVSLVNNAIGETITLMSPLNNGAEQRVRITLPAGTQFLDENGNVLRGSQLTALIVNVDTDKEDALKIFPGSSLATENIYQAGATSPVSGVFNPGALTNIQFFLDGTPVKRFSQPIEIGQQLQAGFREVGDAVSVYSHAIAEARWQHEHEVLATETDGIMESVFQTDHLTWFLSGDFMRACDEPATVQLQASWFDAGVSYPLTVEAIIGNKVAMSFTVTVNAENSTARLSRLPSQGVTLRIKDEREAILGEAALTSCGGTTSITLLDPATVADPTVTLQLYVRCPGQSDVISVLPTFYLYYREHGSGDDFKFLGVVTNGFLSTKLLTVDTVPYDFKAIWGNEIKIVGNHTVQEDNSGTVGIEPGDIIGTKAGATNLAILTEKCNELNN